MGAVKTRARRPGPREEGLGASCPFKPQLPACLAVPSPAPLVAPPGGRTSAAARRPGRWALPPPRPRQASRRRRVRLRRRGRALANRLGAHARGGGASGARAGRGPEARSSERAVRRVCVPEGRSPCARAAALLVEADCGEALRAGQQPGPRESPGSSFPPWAGTEFGPAARQAALGVVQTHPEFSR